MQTFRAVRNGVLRCAFDVLCHAGLACLVAGALSTAARAQAAPVRTLDLPIGRSFPIRADTTVTRISIANTAIADVVVVSDREVVINSIAPGETDAIIWLANGTLTHYRISVHSPADRKQIAISIHFAEVRRDALREIGVSGLWRDQRTRAGTGIFRSDEVFSDSGSIRLPANVGFGTFLSDLGTNNLLALLDALESKGSARFLAEPMLM